MNIQEELTELFKTLSGSLSQVALISGFCSVKRMSVFYSSWTGH